MEKLKVALDCDDVLFECVGYALSLENKRLGLNMVLEDRTQWQKQNDPTDGILRYFNKPDFFATQPVYDGAKEFVKELCSLVDVYIMTAIDPMCAGVRASRILTEFPEIDPSHIILGSSKELLHVDVLLDDAPHNILSSSATYPVLMRRPWNRTLSGLLSVDGYDEFLDFIRTLLRQNTGKSAGVDNNVYCFVGPSGSGKTAILETIAKQEGFEKVKTTTSRAMRDNETADSYNFVTREQFEWMKQEKMFLETTCYGGEYYGATKEAVFDILRRGKDVLVAIDIAGAIAVKSLFGDSCKLVFVERPKKEIILSILKRNISDEEKAMRILSLDSEHFNKRFCDYVIENNRGIEDAVELFEKYIEDEK